MSLLFMDSFANWGSAAVGALGKWTSIVDITGGIFSLNATAGRNGGPAAVFTEADPTDQRGSGTYLAKTLPNGQTTLTVGFALNVSSRSAGELTFLALNNITDRLIGLSILQTGQLRIRAGDETEFALATLLGTTSGGVIAATNVWYYIEVQVVVSPTVGQVNIQVNGANVLTLSGVNTDPLSLGSINNYQLGWPPGTTINVVTLGFMVCDHYVTNSSGSQNTGFLGDTRVACVFPNANGTTNQFAANGAASNYLCVNEASEDGDATYVSSATVGQIDEYTKTATPTNTGTIFGVQLCAVARKDAAGTRHNQNFILSDVSTTLGADNPLALSYAWYLDIIEQDPNTSAAWTKTGLDAAQIGVKVSA